MKAWAVRSLISSDSTHYGSRNLPRDHQRLEELLARSNFYALLRQPHACTVGDASSRDGQIAGLVLASPSTITYRRSQSASALMQRVLGHGKSSIGILAFPRSMRVRFRSRLVWQDLRPIHGVMIQFWFIRLLKTLSLYKSHEILSCHI